MPRYLPTEQVRALQRRALEKCGTIRQTADGTHSRVVEWDAAGDCLSPVFVGLHGRPVEPPGSFVVSKANPPAFLDMWVPCRKCEHCLARRAAHWRLRARSEFDAAQRTWFATLTYHPVVLFRNLTRTRVRLAKARVHYEELPPHEQFIEAERECFSDVQRWLKRLRKNSGATIRYLAVTERHKSGDPHFHVLLHEQCPERPLRYDADLKGSWGEGFDSFRLLGDKKEAAYLAKYLSKDLSARVRASKGYGAT